MVSPIITMPVTLNYRMKNMSSLTEARSLNRISHYGLILVVRECSVLKIIFVRGDLATLVRYERTCVYRNSLLRQYIGISSQHASKKY